MATVPANLADAVTDPLGLGLGLGLGVGDVGTTAATAEEHDVKARGFGAMSDRFDGRIGVRGARRLRRLHPVRPGGGQYLPMARSSRASPAVLMPEPGRCQSMAFHASGIAGTPQAGS